MSRALLLAEPQPETRGFLERHLTSDGFHVVDDGARPDLVLLGGTAALDACRERHGDVPVIVLGEPESDTVDRVRALDRGCDDFLAKPFDYEELLGSLSGLSDFPISALTRLVKPFSSPRYQLQCRPKSLTEWIAIQKPA